LKSGKKTVQNEDVTKVEEPVVDPDTLKNIKTDELTGDMVFSSNLQAYCTKNILFYAVQHLKCTSCTTH
jgi:hypothetical protein